MLVTILSLSDNWDFNGKAFQCKICQTEWIASDLVNEINGKEDI